MRKFIFNLLFKGQERVFMIHALWMASFDYTEQFGKACNEDKKRVCAELAKELM